MTTQPLWRSRIASICEVVVVLVLGNLLARSALRLFLPGELLAVTFDPASGNALSAALGTALTLAVRFAVLLGLAFSLLRVLSRRSPRDAGVRLGGATLAGHAGAGVVLFALASLPWKLVLFVNALAPFGAGLGAWDDIRTAGWHADVIVLVLCRAVLLPPLLEEPMARGYMLTRLRVGGWGVMGSVLLSALLFQLSHGHFYRADPVVILLLVSGIFAAACWAYVTVRTGTIVPAVIAHALANMPEPATAWGLGLLLAAMSMLLVWRRTAIVAIVRDFTVDWAATPNKRQLVLVTVATAIVMTSAALYRPLILVVAAGALLGMFAFARPVRAVQDGV